MKRCRERYSSNLKQSLVQNQFTKNRLRPLSGLVLMGLLASTAQAGKITSVPSASDAEGFGGWNEGNIDVIVNGTQGVIGDEYSWYDELTGAYNFADDSDSNSNQTGWTNYFDTPGEYTMEKAPLYHLVDDE